MTLEEALRWARELPLVAQALSRLAKELSPELLYHCAAHTDDVLTEVLRFALHDGLSERDLELLAIAAAFHDLGFLEKPTDNEAVGAEMAVAAMSAHGGYALDEQQSVRAAILDTRVIMSPKGPRQISQTRLSNYLLDADVSNLGREDFFEKAELVRREIAQPDSRAFFEGLKIFLGAHDWYSPAARALRGEQKKKNIAALDQRLRSLP